MPAVRLQKLLSMAGLASRRGAEILMQQGRVTVNGRTVTELGAKADALLDDVRVDGRRVRSGERPRYLLLNKPAGYVSTRKDPEGRPTVLDLLRGVREYVYPVGRLDYDSEGLLLLTNDGELAAALTHPRHGVEKVYHAVTRGVPDLRALAKLEGGVALDGRRTAPARARVLKTFVQKGREDAVVEIALREGRNRQVRRMCQAVGFPVQRLTRVGIGPLHDARLAPGSWRELTAREVERLKRPAAVEARRR